MSTSAHHNNHVQPHPLTVARVARGWSQAYLAELLGVSTRTVVRWEAGQTLPYPIYREQLHRLLGLNLMNPSLFPPRDTLDEEEVMPPDSPQSRLPSLYDPMIPEIAGLLNRFQGRDAALQQIKQLLFTGERAPSLALRGLPGVGKTALALALITDAQVQAYFSDGILWAQMGPRASVPELLAHWGALLGLQEAHLNNSLHWSSLGRSLRTSIGQRRMLLVIDDAWSIEDALALQVGGAQCAHLLTTRLPPVAFGFAQDMTMVVPELSESDGLALLAHFVPQVLEQEEADAHALVQITGGLPLALNLLGKHLAMQALMGQPRRLKTALSHLLEREHRMNVSLPIPLIERPGGLALLSSLSLQATIALSVEQLSQEERKDLIALALFPARPNSFSEEAAQAVIGGPVERLDALWDIGLLESAEPGRYTLHQTIVDYARELATDEAIWQRLGTWAIDLLRRHQHDDALLAQERANIEAYLARSHRDEIAWEILSLFPPGTHTEVSL